jgi:hypothetical protein
LAYRASAEKRLVWMKTVTTEAARRAPELLGAAGQEECDRLLQLFILRHGDGERAGGGDRLLRRRGGLQRDATHPAQLQHEAGADHGHRAARPPHIHVAELQRRLDAAGPEPGGVGGPHAPDLLHGRARERHVYVGGVREVEHAVGLP